MLKNFSIYIRLLALEFGQLLVQWKIFIITNLEHFYDRTQSTNH